MFIYSYVLVTSVELCAHGEPAHAEEEPVVESKGYGSPVGHSALQKDAENYIPSALLRQIQCIPVNIAKPHRVSVLDFENAWVYYPGRVARDPLLATYYPNW